MLRIWLDLHRNGYGLEIAPTRYEIIWVQEQVPFDLANVRAVLRNWLRNCYVSPEVVKRRIAAGAYYSNEDLYQREKFPDPTNLKVRHGDFGEAVGHFVLEAHPTLGFCLPIFRLRSKDDKEKSHFGFDLIGFKFAEENEGKNVLCIGEAKLRTKKDDKTLSAAHAALSNYDRPREIEQVGRVAHQLLEEGRDQESDKLARFGEGWAKQEIFRRHVAIGIIDSAVPLDAMFKRLNDVDPMLTTFCVCIILVKGLRRAIEEAYRP